MAIQKRFIHFKKFSDFNSKKLSANEANTQYTVGISGAIQDGEPDVLYQSYCWIKDTKQQWTHGQLYDGTNLNEVGFLAGEETSEELDDVETNTYVKYVQQTLTDEQKAQTRNNIDAISESSLKTINGESIVGNGNITISGGSSNESAEVYLTPFTVEQFCTGYVELTDEQRDELINAASQNRIIGMPFEPKSSIGITVHSAGYIIADYSYSLYVDEPIGDVWHLYLGVIYEGTRYENHINSNFNPNNFTNVRAVVTPFKPLVYVVTVEEDGVAYVYDDVSYPDNCMFWVDGECTELYIYLEPSKIGKTVRFFTGESCTLEFTFPVYWANGEVPTIESYTHYELSLVANMEGGFNTVLTPFKLVE